MVHGTNCLWCLRLRELRRRGDVLAKQLGYLRLRLRGECRPATSPRISYRTYEHRPPPNKVALSALVWLLPPNQPKEPLRGTQSSQHSSWFAQPVPGARARDVLPPLVYRGHCPITPFCRPGLGDDAIQYYSVMFIVCSRLFSVAARFLIHLTYLAWTVIISSSFCNEEPVCPFWVCAFLSLLLTFLSPPVMVAFAWLSATCY